MRVNCRSLLFPRPRLRLAITIGRVLVGSCSLADQVPSRKTVHPSSIVPAAPRHLSNTASIRQNLARILAACATGSNIANIFPH